MQVGDPSHSMCRKIMWKLDFHNNMLIYIHTTVTSGVIFVFVLLFDLGAKAVTFIA